MELVELIRKGAINMVLLQKSFKRDEVVAKHFAAQQGGKGQEQASLIS
jgi:hypothetical protein